MQDTPHFATFNSLNRFRKVGKICLEVISIKDRFIFDLNNLLDELNRGLIYQGTIWTGREDLLR